MKKFYAMAVMTAMLVGATSCSNDDEMATPEGPEQSRSLIVENVGVSALTRSGITANSFTSGETLGLYIYRGNGIAEAYNDASSTIPTVNVPYVQGAGGWSATQPIILSSVVGKVYSYYPYAAGNNTQDGTAIPVSVAANQGTGQSDGVKDVTEQSDYMYGTVVSGISNKAPQVSLTMNHALAMVSFKFVQTSDATIKYPGEGKVSSIVLKNKTGKEVIKQGDATMHIGTGAITGGTAGSITLAPDASATLMDVTDAAKMPRLLLYPVAALAADDAEVTVTVDGNDYTIALPELAAGYVAGSNYLYTFTLKGTGLEVTNVTITEWVDAEGGTGDIETPDDQTKA